MPATTRRTRKPATATTTPDETTTPATDPTPTADETAATADPAPATTPAETAPTDDPAPAVTPDESAPTADPAPGGGTPAEAPVSGAPTSGAPVGSGDHLKIVMVAGILGDHLDGVTAAAIVDESGLRAAIVGRVLAAMETAGAAVRKPATTDDDKSDATGVELWVRGEADLTTVDLSDAVLRTECPTCHRPMPRRNTVNVTRAPAAPGHNSDGSRTLAKNELRTIVRDFLLAHPGHEFTPTTLSREIGRSSGATANALAKLVVSGEAVLVREVPATFAAPETAAAPAADPATESDTATTDK